MLKAVRIKWDTDGDMDILKTLPTEMIIPGDLEEMYSVDRDSALEDISDWLTEVTDYCHNGFMVMKKENNMHKTYFRVEMVYGSGKFPEKYDTYEAAYDAMCKNYVREINEDYKPTLYKIVRYDHTEWNGSKNTMIQPVWS